MALLMEMDYRLQVDRMTSKHRPGSEKAVQAEMKNKMEYARLQKTKKFYDRQSARTEWHIEKEKRQAVNAQRKMSTTSGVSQEGLRPSGPNDNYREKSLYFRGGATVSNKRLQEWRIKDKQLEKMMANSGEIPTPLSVWEYSVKRQVDTTMEKLGPMMRRLGYDVEDSDLMNNVTEHNNGAEEYAGIKLSYKPEISLKSTISQEIGEMKGTSNSEESITMSSVDVFDCLRNDDEERECPSSDAYGENVGFSAKKWEKKYIKNYLLTISKPAPDNMLNANGECAIDCNKSENKTLDSAREINDIFVEDKLQADKVSRKWGKKEKNTNVYIRPHSVHALQRKKSLKGGRPASAQIPKRESSKRPGRKEEIVILEHQATKTNESLIHTAEISSFDDSKGKRVQPLFQNQIENRQSEVSSARHRGVVHGSKFVRKESAICNESAQAVYGRKIETVLDSRAGQCCHAKDKTFGPNQTEISSRQLRRRSEANGRDQGRDHVLAGEAAGDTHVEEHYHVGRRVSRWRRDLMMEAPPGVFTNKEPVKVALVMSKSQRQRELDKLIDDNRSDGKRIACHEQTRRLQNRLNVFLAVSKVEEAASRLGGCPN